MGRVEEVERLEPVLHAPRLAEEWKRPSFCQRRVHVGEARPEQAVPAERAVRVRGRVGEALESSIRVARIVEVRCQALPFGPAGIQHGVSRADQVRARRPGPRHRVVRCPDAKGPPGLQRRDAAQPPVAQNGVRRRSLLQPGQVPDERIDEPVRPCEVGVAAREEKIEWIVNAAAAAEPVA